MEKKGARRGSNKAEGRVSLRCSFCGKRSPSVQGLRAHERWCEKNPKRLKPGDKTKRKYSRKAEAIEIQYCPQCGLHLGALTLSRSK